MPPTALFVMDFQTLIRGHIPDTSSFDAAAWQAAELLAAARALGPEKVLLVHVIAGGSHRTNEKLYGVRTESVIGGFMDAFPASVEKPGIVDIVAPLPEELVLSRPRASPFHDTALPSLLRSHGIQKLILTGVATSGVVLSTFRSAADADYDVVVVGDACADIKPEMHTMLVEEYFGNPFSGGRVLGVEQAKKELAQ